ncbi:MAG: hypothetical protein D6753_03740 [Planctomycetota bacterium]|nr:MAG: hypothetical protein D6753_03740 [Planctomycetota bacterium]
MSESHQEGQVRSSNGESDRHRSVLTGAGGGGQAGAGVGSSTATPASAPHSATQSPTATAGTSDEDGASTVAKKSDPVNEKLASELRNFEQVAADLRGRLEPVEDFHQRCLQAFDIANELFGHAPTWVCFYRELMGTDGFIRRLFPGDEEFGVFLRSDQYHQIQLMLTALRSRDLPENDPNDPQRMITVRLPKSLHEAMCEEAERLNISVNRLCISRMLQLLDPKMIPKNSSKPRGRKPRKRTGKPAQSASGTSG